MKKALCLVLTLLITVSMLAPQMPAIALGEPVNPIYNEYKDYFITQSTAENIKFTAIEDSTGESGLSATITVYSNGKSTSDTTVIMYVIGHSMPRVGTEDDISILNDYILGNTENDDPHDDNGYVVAVVDFHNDKNAVDANIKNAILQLVTDMKTSGKYLGGVKCAWAAPKIYFCPAGCRVAFDIEYYDLLRDGINGTDEFITYIWNTDWAGKALGSDGRRHEQSDFENSSSLKKVRDFNTVTTTREIMQKDGVTPVDTSLKMDIIYPSKPNRTVPVNICFSSHERRSSALTVSAPSIQTVFDGYATVIGDHEYPPFYREDAGHYGYYADSYFTLGNFISNHTGSALVRCIRYYASKYGYDADYMGGWGFSKSSMSPAWLANASRSLDKEARSYNSVAGFEYKDASAPDPVQPWLTYDDGTPISSNITVTYSGSGPGILDQGDKTLPNPEKGEVSIPFMSSSGTLDETGGFYRKWASYGYKRIEDYNMEALALSIEGLGHKKPRGYGKSMGIDYWDTYYAFFNNQIRAAYRKEPPLVLWTLPLDQSKFSSANVPVEVKFTRSMDVDSVKKGIKVINEATGEAVDGEWSMLHGNTRFTFVSSALDYGARYRIEVGESCKAKDGVHLKEKMIKRFEITDAEVTDVSKDAYISSVSPDTNYGTAASISIKNEENTINKGYIGFEKEGGFGDVSKAVLVFKGSKTGYLNNIYGLNDTSWSESGITWNNAPANNKDGAGFDLQSVYGGGKIGMANNVSEGVNEVDVTDYVKSLSGNTATFAFESPSKKGYTKQYTFEDMTDDDFVRNTDYRLGGQGIKNDVGYHTDFINDANSYDGTYFSFCNRTAASARIKFANMFGLENNTLTQDDLGKTFTVTAMVRPAGDDAILFGLMSATDGSFATSYYDVKKTAAPAGKWTPVTYTFTVNQEMIDNNTSYLTIGADTAISAINIDNLCVMLETGENEIVSKEGKTSANGAPKLVLIKGNSQNADSLGSAYVQSGDKADTNLSGEANLYVKGADLRNKEGNQKGYVKIPLDNVDTASSVKLNFSILSSSKQKLSVYGIDAPLLNSAVTGSYEGPDEWDNEITWNRAFANDKNANGIDLNFAYGNAPLAEIDCTVSGKKEIDVTSFVRKLKTDGAANATFVFAAQNQNVTRTIDFEGGMNDFEKYSPNLYNSSKAAGLSVVYDEDRKSNVLLFKRDDFFDAVTIKDFITPNDKWTSADIGKTYKISAYVKTHTGISSTSRIIMGVTSYGANTSNTLLGSANTDNSTKWEEAAALGTLLYKSNISDGAGWHYLENTFTITEDMVNNHSAKTAFIICGYAHTKNMYVDDLKCEEVGGTAFITTGEDKVSERNFEDGSLSGITVTQDGGSSVNAPLSDADKVYVRGDIIEENGNKFLMFQKRGNYTSDTDKTEIYNGYNPLISVSHLLGDGITTFREEDIGKTYRVTFDFKSNKSINNGFRMALGTNSSSFTYNTGEGWVTKSIEYTVPSTITTSPVNARLRVGSYGFSNAGVENYLYIDNVKVEEITGNAPCLVLTNADATTKTNNAANCCTINSSYPDTAFANQLTVKREDYSETAVNSKKAYLAFDVDSEREYKGAILKFNILKNALSGNPTVNIYGLLNADFNKDTITFNNAPSNNKSTNSVILSSVFGGAPVANISALESGKKNVDVSNYIKSLSDGNKAVFAITTEDKPNSVVYEKDFENGINPVYGKDLSFGGQSSIVTAVKTESNGNKYLEVSNLNYTYSRIKPKKSFGVPYFTEKDIGTKYKISLSVKPNVTTEMNIGVMSTYPGAPNSGATIMETTGGYIKNQTMPAGVWTDVEFIYTVNANTVSNMANALSIGDQSGADSTSPKSSVICIDNIKVEKLDGTSEVEIEKNASLSLDVEKEDSTPNTVQISDYQSTGNFNKGDSVYVNVNTATSFGKSVENVDFYVNGELVTNELAQVSNGAVYTLKMINLSEGAYEVYAVALFSDGQSVTSETVNFNIGGGVSFATENAKVSGSVKDAMRVSKSIKSNLSEDKSAVAILAFYDENNNLISIEKSAPGIIGAGEVKTFTVSVANPSKNAGAAYAKFMIWSDYDYMLPYVQAEIIK